MVNPVKVSVIFPIYNREVYLERCISSVISQTLKDIEIILIDDGSTDKSREICDYFLNKDERVRVIHKKNEGSAKARNLGMELAQGEYIAFVESDDYVDPDMYRLLYEQSIRGDVDVVKCGFYYCTKDAVIREYSFLYDLADQNGVIDICQKPEIFLNHPCIWAGIYKKEFIDQRGLKFIETPGASYSDFSFMMKTFSNVETVSVVKKPLYFYTYDNPDSSYLKAGKLYKWAFLHAVEGIKAVKQSPKYNYIKEYACLRVYTACMHSAENVSDEMWEDCFKLLKESFLYIFDDSIELTYFKKWQKKTIKSILGGHREETRRLLPRHEISIDDLEGKKIVLFGIGSCGQELLVRLKRRNVVIEALIDNNPNPELEIYPPQRIKSIQYDLILVTVGERDIYDEIKEQLISMNVDEDVIIWMPYIYE